MARVREPGRPDHRRSAVPRAGRAARLPRRLHLAHRARRLLDRRRDPGRARPVRGDARRPVAEGLARPVSGTVIKFWDTLKEIPDTLRRDPRRLGLGDRDPRRLREVDPDDPRRPRRRRRQIAISWGFDLESHGVSTLGVVPSGLPSIGFPRASAGTMSGRCSRLGLDVPRDHRPERRDLPSLRRQVQGPVRREQRPRWAQHREHRGRA